MVRNSHFQQYFLFIIPEEVTYAGLKIDKIGAKKSSKKCEYQPKWHND